jgi:hypothetical protein
MEIISSDNADDVGGFFNVIANCGQLCFSKEFNLQ